MSSIHASAGLFSFSFLSRVKYADSDGGWNGFSYPTRREQCTRRRRWAKRSPLLEIASVTNGFLLIFPVRSVERQNLMRFPQAYVRACRTRVYIWILHIKRVPTSGRLRVSLQTYISIIIQRCKSSAHRYIRDRGKTGKSLRPIIIIIFKR